MKKHQAESPGKPELAHLSRQENVELQAALETGLTDDSACGILSPVAQPRPKVTWESVPCNLCGRDNTAIYHCEQLPYFGQRESFQIVRCKNCGLVYTNPRIAQHNATYLQGQDESPAAIEAHARAKLPVFKSTLDCLERLHGPATSDERAMKILDVGCGSGHFLAEARRRGYKICGIEPAKVSADYAEQQLHMPVIRENFLQVELPDETYDIITAWDVIEHVSDPRAVLQKCVRKLRPGGIIALRFPSATWQKIKGVAYQKLLHSDRASFGGTMHLYFFNEDTFCTMARQIGLEPLLVKSTMMEMNSDNPMLNCFKKISGMMIKSVELLANRHIGNLEIYCRK